MHLKKYIYVFFLFFLIGSFVLEFREKKENKIKMAQFFSEEKENKKIIEVSTDSYLGILEIPTLKLKQGFYSFSSPLNTVDKGLMLISGSTMPNQENSAFILAAHSGNSAISFFKKLNQIKEGEEAFVYYGNKKYNYYFKLKYTDVKDGTVEIRKSKNKKELFLITCDQNKTNLQEIYVFSFSKESIFDS